MGTVLKKLNRLASSAGVAWSGVGIAAALFLSGGSPSDAATREYFIAAEEVQWDYAPARKDLTHDAPLPDDVSEQTVWQKVRYIEYTNQEFRERKRQPTWLGLLGPVIRAEVGDTVVVHFLNKAKQPYSMHPHGLRYTKDEEGGTTAQRGEARWSNPANSTRIPGSPTR